MDPSGGCSTVLVFRVPARTKETSKNGRVRPRRNHAMSCVLPASVAHSLIGTCPVAELAHRPLRSGLVTRPRVRRRSPAVLGEEKNFGCGRSLLIALFFTVRKEEARWPGLGTAPSNHATRVH